MKNNVTFSEAQSDMRSGYLGGAPGMFASSLVWLVAGFVALQRPPQQAVIALFVGGMMIHPAGVLFCKILGRSGAHGKGNPLGRLALEGLIWMLLSMAIAYGVSLWRIELFFPAMLLIIGGRYLSFATMFGMRIYWLLGAALAGAGWLLAAKSAPIAAGAFVGAAIEMVFSLTIYFMTRHTQASPIVQCDPAG